MHPLRLFSKICGVLHPLHPPRVSDIMWLLWMFIPGLLGSIYNNSDTLETFKLVKTMVFNQFKSTIKAVQSDWGREFRPFTKFLTQNGIQHRLICPHTHHPNGVVERKHKNIVELGVTLLS